MSEPFASTLHTYRYDAQTHEGRALSGTVDASTHEVARAALTGMGLRIVALEETGGEAARPKALRGAEFMTFNAQLAQLAEAGMPLESGLRLIAQDVRSQRLRATIEQVAADLERGASLGEAFERHRRLFPPLYAGIVEAGVKSGNLAATLFSLGRHLELVSRLRAAIWRTAAYPLVVLAIMVALTTLLGLFIVPTYSEILSDWDVQMPWTTQVLMHAAPWVPAALIGLLVVVAACAVGWASLRAAGREQAAIEATVLPLPLLGPVLKRNLVARWCDALRVGVEAGLDLPASLQLAADAVGSPGMRRDADLLIQAMRQGVPIDRVSAMLQLSPATVPAAIHLAAQRHDLPSLLSHLARLYEDEAEARLIALQAWLTPLLLLVIAVVMGFVVAAMFSPLVALIQAVT